MTIGTSTPGTVIRLSTPPQTHYTVTGTNFTPSVALQGGDRYYWYVVGNSGSASGPASATWSFWVTGAASLVSVTPASGGPPAGGLGTPTTFDFRFSSPNGWQDIGWTQMEFNYYNTGAGACFIGVWPGSGQVVLANDTGSDHLWIGTLGQTQPTQANSQCSVNLAQSSMTVESPVQMKITLVLTFYAGMPGPQQIWMRAGANEGDLASWQPMGTWTTSTVTPQGPSMMSGTMPPQPASGGRSTWTIASPLSLRMFLAKTGCRSPRDKKSSPKQCQPVHAALKGATVPISIRAVGPRRFRSRWAPGNPWPIRR